MSNSYSEHLNHQKKVRLEKVSLDLLSGIMSNNYYTNFTNKGLCKKAIELAKEFIEQIDDEGKDRTL